MSDLSQTKIRQLDFTLLLIFQSLLRRRQATATAQELGLSSSAISHALARLRRLFGDPLFRRLPHGLEPTRHALALGSRVDALVRDGREALGMTETFIAERAHRDFRLAAPDHLGTILAVPLVQHFRKRAPNARFALSVLLGEDALEQLRRNQSDVALGQFLGDLDGFNVKRLYTDRYVLVARRNHPGLTARLSKKQFERLEHVAISAGGDFRVLTDAQFRRLGVSRRIVATVPRFTTAFETVSRTDAVAIAPERLARAQANTFGLKIFALPRSLPHLQMVAVRRVHPDPGVDWLVASIEAILAT
jgi:DNA-binding transcriptional LysR family regulator